MTDLTVAVPAETSTSELDAVLDQAVQAAGPWGALTPAERAARLRAVADALDGARAELVPLAQAESHLPEARLTGELGRTTAQLRLFAAVLDHRPRRQQLASGRPGRPAPAAGTARSDGGVRGQQLPVRIQHRRR
jgi:acyl-CoA reductase-like NAD-dependent aldehyde dehydrogenase